MCTFAAEMVMYGCFTRARKGNQVRILSSTRYCHPHYGKFKKTTGAALGRRTYRGEPGDLPCST